MAVDLKKFERLKSRLEDARRRQQRAEAVRDELLAELERDWGCKTVAAAEKSLRKLEAEAEKAEAEFETKLDEFEREWGDA